MKSQAQNGSLGVGFQFFCLLCLTTVAMAADLAPEPITLSEAIQMAVEKNPALQLAHYRVAASESQITQARAGLYPQVYLSETFNRTNNPMWAFGTRLNQQAITQADFAPSQLNDPKPISNFGTAVKMDWSIYNGGQTRIGINQAVQSREAAALAMKKIRQSVIAHTATAYVGLLLARKNLIVTRQALETAQAHLKMVQARVDSGFAVKSDLLRAKVRIAELNHAVLQADSRVKVAYADLVASMGGGGGRSFDPVSPLERCRKITRSEAEWIDLALANRPELGQLKFRENMAREEVARSRAAHFPTVNLVGTYEIDTEDFGDLADHYTVGAVMQMNLFSGRRISAKVVEAKAFLQQVRAEKNHLELNIDVQTRQAFFTAQSAWRQIEVAQSAVAQAEESLRIVRNRYRNGLITIVSLLDSEVALQKARTRHFRAMHDYKVARINLALAAGILDIDFK